MPRSSEPSHPQGSPGMCHCPGGGQGPLLNPPGLRGQPYAPCPQLLASPKPSRAGMVWGTKAHSPAGNMLGRAPCSTSRGDSTWEAAGPARGSKIRSFLSW